MKLKKIAAMLCISSMLVASLASCSADFQKNSSDKQTVSSDRQVSNEVELSVSIWDSYQEPGIKEILNDFTKETGIKTKLTVVKWDEYWTMLEAGAQGGSLPDVFWMHSNESQRYMSNDMLLDITDKIAASDQIKKENYPEDIWDLYTWEGKNYAIPKDIDTVALWYNKTMFDEANLEYPTANWTWEDFTQAAKALTKKDGSQYGFALRNTETQSGYYNMIYANNGYIISDDKQKSGWDDPKTIEAIQMIEGWIQDGIMPSLEVMSENPEHVLFSSGKVAMIMQGSWMLAAHKENEYVREHGDCVELPKNSKTGRSVSIYNGLGWAASANGEHTQEAWKLLEYLGSKQAQEKQAELGITMSAYKGTSDAWINSSDFNLQAYLNMMDDIVIRPYSKSTVLWEDKANELMKDLFAGKPAQEVCEAIASAMNEILQGESQ